MENPGIEDNIKSGNDYFFQKKIELIVDTNNRKLITDLNSIKNMISNLQQEVSLIKKKIGMISDNSKPKTQTVMFEESKMNKKNFTDKSKNDEPQRPRYEDYKPEDVSVNKFFYFGNKQ